MTILRMRGNKPEFREKIRNLSETSGNLAKSRNLRLSAKKTSFLKYVQGVFDTISGGILQGLAEQRLGLIGIAADPLIKRSGIGGHRPHASDATLFRAVESDRRLQAALSIASSR